jgi:hypothetical protein
MGDEMGESNSRWGVEGPDEIGPRFSSTELVEEAVEGREEGDWRGEPRTEPRDWVAVESV